MQRRVVTISSTSPPPRWFSGLVGRPPNRLLTLYFAVTGILVVAYYRFPGHHLALWTPLGLLTVAAMVVGIRRHRPSQPAGWYLLAAATFCFIAGDTTYNVLEEVLGSRNPYPSIADALYLLTYPLFAAGLFLLIRGRTTTRDRASLLDALIITTGVALLVWVYLVVPSYEDQSLSALQRAVSMSYPLGDVLVLGMLARLVAGGGLRLRATQLLVVGAVGLLAADIVYGLSQLQASYNMGGVADLGWIVFYAGWGAAALHPSMRAVTDPVILGASSEVRPGSVGLVASVGLIAPVILLADALANSGKNAVSVGAFSACLYALVLLRLSGIVSVHKQSVVRERVLRISGESLVTAQDIDQISLAAFAGVASLTDATQDAAVAIYLADSADGGPVVNPAGDSRSWDEARMWVLAATGGGLADGNLLSVSPFRSSQDVRGMLAVRSDLPLTLDTHGALMTLGSQVALALESNRLASDLRERQNDAHFTSLIQNAMDIIVVVAADGRLMHGSEALARALGLDAAPPSTARLQTLVHPDDELAAARYQGVMAARPADDVQTSDWRLRHADGDYRSFEVVARNLLHDPTVAGVVYTMRDVSQRRALEEQLKYQAFHDGLTNLPNRALFQDRAIQALSRLPRGGHYVAMVMLDLDDFKEVNDTSGHAAGDGVLCAVARRLGLAMRPGDTAARLGGDEFAVLVETVPDIASAEAIATRVMDAFVAPFVVNEELFFVHASGGLVIAGDTDDDVDLTELLLRADLALYAAKDRGKGQFQRYESDLRKVRTARVTKRAELKLAVEQEQFFLQYQPIVEIATGEVVGAEALVRWRHPRLGVVGPDEFIPLAEETGLIVPLGRWVMDNACAQARIWGRTSLGRLRMCVNVSARQLQETTFVDDVRAALSQHDIAPGSLVVELTETVLFSEGEGIAERLAALKHLGIKLAIDDFGTGYSSLSYLQHFAIDILKVDKSFVDGLGAGSSDAGALAQAMVSLAHLLRLEVVAEGIERREQRDELWSLGCGLGQGFFYAKPLDAVVLTELLSGPGHLGGPSVQATQGVLARLRQPAALPAHANPA